MLDYNDETCQGKFTVLLGDISSGIALQGSVPEKSGLPRHANLNDRKRLARSRDSTQMFQVTSKRGSVIVRWFLVLCPRFKAFIGSPRECTKSVSHPGEGCRHNFWRASPLWRCSLKRTRSNVRRRTIDPWSAWETAQMDRSSETPIPREDGRLSSCKSGQSPGDRSQAGLYL